MDHDVSEEGDMIDLGSTPAGMTIHDAATKAVNTLRAIYKEWGNVGGLVFEFNGETVTVYAAYSVETVVEHYCQVVHKRELVSR